MKSRKRQKRKMRTKKKRSKLIIFLSLMSLIALLFVGYQASLSIGGGGQILSIDQISQEGQGDTAQYVILATANDGAEKASVTLAPSRFASLPTQPTEEVTIEFELRKSSVNYALVKDENSLGEIYYQFVTEQCLANPCPYDAIDLDDVRQHCLNGGGKDQRPSVSSESCERMVDLIAMGGSKTEHCAYTPEESNVDAPGECRNSVIEREVEVFPVDSCIVGDENLGGTRVQTKTVSISEGANGGDWQVMSIGFVPTHNLYRISSVAQLQYEAVVRVIPKKGGESSECVLDPQTKSCTLPNNLGKVQFVGNLGTNTGFPDPGNDAMVVRNLNTQEWKDVDAGIGSSLAAWLTTFNTLKNMNTDYYTFSAVPVGEIEVGFICDPSVGQPVFPEITAANNLYPDSINKKPVDYGFTCEVQNGTYVCDTVGELAYPLLKLTLNAKEVGIITPEGMPNILGIGNTPTQANAGERELEISPGVVERIYVAVENIGEEQDSFDVRLECPFAVTQQSARIAVEPKSASTVELLGSGEGNIQTCTIKAVSVGYPANLDTQAVRVRAQPSCTLPNVGPEQVIFTEYGCVPAEQRKSCPEGNTWLGSVGRCVTVAEIEEKTVLLEEAATKECTEQCLGEGECILTCLDQGGMRPVCTGRGTMISLNDFLCDADTEKAYVPSDIPGKVWVDAPVCNFVCPFGFEGRDCEEITEGVQFDYTRDLPLATEEQGQKQCASCFDGIKNQDEQGKDCGGICEKTYGQDKSCGKVRAPDSCYNHMQDADEEGRDCGGSCDYSCNELVQDYTPEKNKNLLVVYGVVLLVGVLLLFLFLRKTKR